MDNVMCSLPCLVLLKIFISQRVYDPLPTGLKNG